MWICTSICIWYLCVLYIWINHGVHIARHGKQVISHHFSISHFKIIKKHYPMDDNTNFNSNGSSWCCWREMKIRWLKLRLSAAIDIQIELVKPIGDHTHKRMHIHLLNMSHSTFTVSNIKRFFEKLVHFDLILIRLELIPVLFFGCDDGNGNSGMVNMSVVIFFVFFLKTVTNAAMWLWWFYFWA